MHEARRFLVSGRVQGVSFRASTRDVAQSLGLSGWVRNRDDGCVEGIAFGEPTALRDFHGWLKRGPGAAKVKKVVFEAIDETPQHPGFLIR
ncbi:MAG TPA: acylphosphatase [Salinisphaeraceae bacterium]|nr:acylphosphatase [Salinisphaeraceae bacterium]